MIKSVTLTGQIKVKLNNKNLKRGLSGVTKLPRVRQFRISFRELSLPSEKLK